MKRVKKNALMRLLCSLLPLLSLTHTFAQDGYNKRPNVNIDPNCNGYVEYLPKGYTGGTKSYPLFLLIPGLGTTGDGSAAALDALYAGSGTPTEQAHDGLWVDSFLVNGVYQQPLLITPQFILPMWNRFPSIDEVNDIISYVIAHYRIDTTRIYLSGVSQGGGPVWEYIGGRSAYANRIAAALPFSGVALPDQQKADRIKHSPVAVWAFHNQFDTDVPLYFTEGYVDMINNIGAPPGIAARKTIFPVGGHVSWTGAMQPGFNSNGAYYPDGLNIYQWMLTKQRTPTRAWAGEDQEIDLPTSSVQLNGGGTGPNGTAASYQWQKLSGPSGGNLSNTSIANPVASNLGYGVYNFRLTVTDNIGGTSTDDVAITVNPSSTRYQAEDYTSQSGTVNSSSTDGTGANGVVVNAIDNTDWMQYSVTVPSAGTYKFRFRVGTNYGGIKFNVLNGSDAVLANVTMYITSGWDSLYNVYADVPLAAGTQTIKLQNSGSFPANVWYINWFEILDNMAAQGPLPVNFVLLNANCANGGVDILWKTSGEVNVNNFSVERSTDGREWKVVGSVPSAGQSSPVNTYQLRDNTGSNNIYRIVEYDVNGKRTYSSIIRSSCNRNEGFALYPNPVIDKAVLSMALEQAAQLDLFVVDGRGALVRKIEALIPKGNSQLTVDLTALPAGSYTINARWANESRSLKIIKK